MNRRWRPGVHGGMNRPDMYIAQLTAQAAWLRAQGDEESAALAEELADRFNTRHEGVLDVTTPEWANEGEGEVIDAAPNIRCWPSPGVVISGPGGKVLTIDPMDGGDVAVVHLGDIIGWVESVHMARAEAREDAEREDYDATVGSGYEGEAIDAEFEETPDEGSVAAHTAREDDHRARLLAEAEGSPYSEAVAGDEVEQNDDRMDARELDAQEDL